MNDKAITSHKLVFIDFNNYNKSNIRINSNGLINQIDTVKDYKTNITSEDFTNRLKGFKVE